MDLLNKLYFILLAVALVAYVLLFETHKNYKRFILLYLILILVTSVVAFYLMDTPAKNNLVVFHVFTVLEYVVLSVLYYHELENKLFKKAMRFSIPVFVFICILLSAFVQKITVNNSDAIILESILLVCYSLFFLRERLLQPEVPSLLQYPMFWISVGILFYFIGSLLVEGLLNYFMRHAMSLALRLYNLSYIFKYLLFILLTMGVFSEKRAKKAS